MALRSGTLGALRSGTLGALRSGTLGVEAAAPTIAPQEGAVAESSTEFSADRPWTTVVWNDPINLMSYVTHVFMEVFGYPRSRAEKLMMDVHTLGRATVSTGTRERMELDVNTLHSYGLWATLQQDA